MKGLYKYELPSGNAEIVTYDAFQAEKEYRYPDKKRDIEKALQEALYELWKLKQ